MADFSSLKQTIQAYIKQNGNEEITGNILQDVLLAIVSTLGDSAINSLASVLQDETTERQNQDGILQGNITAETTARRDADTALGGRIDGLQTVINGINTKLAEGCIYAGIATPSTDPGIINGKVFYVAVQAGTYTNFSNLTVAQGINILKYNGSSWSKDVVYAIDARPKKNSQNFVISGGVFDNMGALDVSELNATENPHTPAQYADLSAALAAIPSDYQKGGMSIKFVQSSDNKYVQYRCISQSFSIYLSNWVCENIYTSGFAYFTGPTYPTFVLQGSNVVITLPSSTLRISSPTNKLMYEIDCSLLENRTFTIISTSILVYDISQNTIKTIYFTQASSEYILLLGNSGGLINGGIWGLLEPYYLAAKNNIEKEIVDRNIATVYFTNALYPSFIQDLATDSQVKIIMPPASMRLFSQSGEKIYEINLNELNTRTFTVASTEKLVYDTVNNRILVVPVNQQNSTYITLFALMGSYRNRGGVTGLLQGYYFASRLCDQNNLVKDINNINKWSDLRLLFFSDVHGAAENVRRIVDMANLLKANNQLDCVINGGDTIAADMSEGLTWYNNLIDGCNVPVLNVAGNHDCWNNASTWEWATQLSVYNLITAKVAQQASIVQPSGAAENGYNYYYKDFGNIRIICICAMSYAGNNLYFDNTQKTWLQNILAATKTTYYYVKAVGGAYTAYNLQSGDVVTATYTHLAQLNSIQYIDGAIYAIPMSVIIVNHSPFGSPYRVESNKINSFAHYDEQNVRTRGVIFDSIKLADDAISIVNDYIENGGAFICWLTGHTHTDNIIKEAQNGNQLMININSANNSKKPDGVAMTIIGWYDYDSFDYVGVDIALGMVKVLRVGWSQDSSMRGRVSWCYDYVNKKLISEN